MNASKRELEKVQCFYAKIGLSDAWDALKRDELYEEAVEKKKALFSNMQDDSGSINEIDDLQPALDLGVRMVSTIDTETGDVTSFEQEEDRDIEKQLVDHVVQLATPLRIEKADTGDIGSDEAGQASGEFNMPYILIKMSYVFLSGRGV